MSDDQPGAAAAATIEAPPEHANGLATYFGVLFAPSDAFTTLARVPMWGWACVLGMVITITGAIVGLPATAHIAQIAQQAAISQAPADQQQVMRDGIGKFAPFMTGSIIFVSLLAPWIGWIITSLLILAGTAIGRGVVSFGKAWVLSVNSYLVFALGTPLINNVILRLQGADNLTKPSDAYVLPSLAMLVHPDVKIGALLYSFNVINLWYYAVLAIGLSRLMKLSAVAAWVTTIVLALVFALIAMAFAK